MTHRRRGFSLIFAIFIVTMLGATLVLLARGFAITPELISKSLLQTGLHRPATDQTLEAYIGEALEKARRGEVRNVEPAIMQVVLFSLLIFRANRQRACSGTTRFRRW